MFIWSPFIGLFHFYLLLLYVLGLHHIFSLKVLSCFLAYLKHNKWTHSIVRVTFHQWLKWSISGTHTKNFHANNSILFFQLHINVSEFLDLLKRWYELPLQIDHFLDIFQLNRGETSFRKSLDFTHFFSRVCSLDDSRDSSADTWDVLSSSSLEMDHILFYHHLYILLLSRWSLIHYYYMNNSHFHYYLQLRNLKINDLPCDSNNNKNKLPSDWISS